MAGSLAVNMVDLLGHGYSDAPDNPDLYNMGRFVQGLAELLDHLGIQRVCWLGYSLGGRIALSAAIAHPQRTSGLVLESASPGLATVEERAIRVHDDQQLADWIEDVGIQRFVDYWEAISLWDSQRRLLADTRQRLRAQRLSNNALGLANSLRGVGTGAQPVLHHRLGELQIPTLLVAGEDDAKYAAIAQDMHKAVGGSRLHIVREAGHTAHLEQPDEFNKTVMDFLGAVLGASPQPARPTAKS
jgi:2-succinyl-6-hydroxy-2,4-cyclohexadiene-1-carboxylate synthase